MASVCWEIRNWTLDQFPPSVQAHWPRQIQLRETCNFLTDHHPKTVLTSVATSCLAISLLANSLRADPYLALEDFNGFCLQMLRSQTTPEYDGVKRFNESFIQEFIKNNNAREDTVLWQTRSSEFAIETHESDHDSCILYGFVSDLPALKEAYLTWRQSLDDTFLGPTELTASSTSSHRAGALLVLQLEDGGVLQLTLNHNAEAMNGFTTLAAIRLEPPSPAALELIGKNAAQETEAKKE